MTKRAFIVHGWSGNPQEGWFPWLKEELEKKGFDVSIPAMPHPDEPVIADWVSHLASEVGLPDSDTYFIGHSVGCQTILRYLETLDTIVGGTVCVAGWFTLSDLETDEEKIIGKPWLQTPIDFEKVKQVCPRITALFSDDDEVVPLQANRPAFQEKLGANIVVETGKGHFSGSDGVTELPSALQAVLDMSK